MLFLGNNVHIISMSTIKTTNPATDEMLNSYAEHSDQEIQKIIGKADIAFGSWRRSLPSERSEKLLRAAAVLRSNKRIYAEMMTLEMGKTFTSAQSEVEKCAWVCEYYAENGPGFLAEELVKSDASESFISYQPMGVVLAVMPWNFPFWQVFRFAAPTLMAGNACLLKHASNVPGCALMIEEVFKEAGFPENVFRTILAGSKQVNAIIEHTAVQGVSLTGSGPAGKAVAAIAGGVLKPSLLELGGSDPYLILDDADIEHAAQQCAESRLLNAGQSCIGAKRFIVQDGIYLEFLAAFLDNMSSAIMGDPFQAVDLGPMARKDLRAEVHKQVTDSTRQGARILLGGSIEPGPGAFYPPTVLAEVVPGMPAYHEEIFGPVASLIKVACEEEAIRVANDTVFGLGAAVFTQDLTRGRRIAAEELQAGCCFVNQYVKSDPRLPFGGIKESGYGRELGKNGIRAFVNIKTVSIL